MTASRVREPAAVGVWLAIIIVFLTAAIVFAVESALHFSGAPIDGPFQLYNALRRIAAGYQGGVDFQFFHGLGLPYLYYNLFRFFGAGLRGAELARNLVSPIAFGLATLVFFRAFTSTWTRTLWATAIVFALAFTVDVSGALFAIVFALNGMLGVRSTMPVIAAAVLFAARTRRQRILGVGIALGLALFYGSEQGLAAVIAFVVVSMIALSRRVEADGGSERAATVTASITDASRVARSIDIASTVAIAVATLVIALVSVAGWHGMIGALRYNFATVPADQYWFFGSPPNTFVPSWSALPSFLAARRLIPAAMLLDAGAIALYFVRFWRARDRTVAHRAMSLLMFAVYGMLSLGSVFGVFTEIYASPCCRVLVLIAVLEFLALADRVGQSGNTPNWFGVPRVAAAAALALSVASIAAVPMASAPWTGALKHVLRAHVLGTEHFEIGGVWPQSLAVGDSIVSAHRHSDGTPPSIWSTYAGWIEARNGVFNPSFDYIIHALGPANREAYVRTFAESKPELVQTVMPMFTQYERWLENTDWAFYDELLTWYDVAATTPWSFYWTRRSTPAPAPTLLANLRVSPATSGMTLATLPPPAADAPADGLRLLEVEIDYTISNPLHRLPLFGNSPRYLVSIGGAVSQFPVSLDPFVSTTRFPIVVLRNQRPVLYFATNSLLPGASFTPTAIRLYERHLDAKNQIWLDNVGHRALPRSRSPAR